MTVFILKQDLTDEFLGAFSNQKAADEALAALAKEEGLLSVEQLEVQVHAVPAHDFAFQWIISRKYLGW